MIQAIVYTSSTGHTETYAKLLSERFDVPYYSLKEADKHLRPGKKIIYLGWVMADTIKGLKTARTTYTIVATGAVGMNFPRSDNQTKLEEVNQITPLFYLQGGLDYTKVKGLKRALLKMIGKQLSKENRPEMKELIQLFQTGGSYVQAKNLEDLIQFVQKQNQKK